MKNLEQQEQPPRSLELARQLELCEDQEEMRQKLGELLESISRDVGREFTDEIPGLYRGMLEEKCLARIERLSRVLETIELQSPMHISDDIEYHYANAVVPEPEGIKIAFSEGQAPGPVRAVVGFGKTLIGFKTENMSVSEISFSADDSRDIEQRKHLCRHVSGDLQKEDIRYLIMRIPANLVEDKYLTQKEKTKKTAFVFRGMKF